MLRAAVSSFEMALLQHNMWCKMSNYELGTRVPMMIRAPWMQSTAGKRTSALVELVDLYPTLADLAGKLLYNIMILLYSLPAHKCTLTVFVMYLPCPL